MSEETTNVATPRSAPPDPTIAHSEAKGPAADKLWANKFKSPEDMEKSYLELQRKVGSQGQPQDAPQEGQTAPSEGNQPPGEAPTQDPPTEAPESRIAEIKESAAALVKDTPVTIDQLAAELAENGDLLPETRQKLRDAGVSDLNIDLHVRNAKAEVTVFTDTVKNLVGGDEGWQKLSEWAASNADKDTLAAVNKALREGDLTTAKPLLQLLSQQHRQAVGVVGTHISGRQGSATYVESGIDLSNQRVARETHSKALRDPRYNVDPDFTRAVNRDVLKIRTLPR